MVVLETDGKCAGPCRLPYELIECNKDNLDEKNNLSLSRGYILSTKDLCGLEFLPQLIKAGVMCFKIEGRMKTPEYVATVTRIYRKYINLALSNEPYKIDKKDIEDLLQVFNRGNFSTGHLDNKPNKELVYPYRQTHMGIYVGNVSNLKQNKGHIFINLTNPISIGDTIQFEKENSKYTISELMIKGKNIQEARSKQFVEIGRMKGNINIGDKVYKIASKDLTSCAKESYKTENKKIPLIATIKLTKNKPITLNVITKNCSNKLFNNINVNFSSEACPVEAKSKPLTEEKILEQLNKTTDTIFEFTAINVELEDNLFLPSIKVLNELRRNALEEILLTAQSNILRKSPKLKELKQFTKVDIKNKAERKVSILLNTLNENEDYLAIKDADNIYIPLKYFSIKKYKDIINKITKKYKTYIYLPTIIKSNYRNLLYNIVENSLDEFKIKGFVISNLGNFIFINELKEKYNKKYEFIGNYTLNDYNNYSIEELKNLNINTLTVSPELDIEAINNLTNYSQAKQELIVYGRTPLMTMNYCLLGKTNKCYPTCGTRCQNNKSFYIKDRMNFHFPVVPDNIQTLTTIYNSKIISISGEPFNVNSYRIDILNESVDEINTIIQTAISGNRFEGKSYTNGNLNREI